MSVTAAAPVRSVLLAIVMASPTVWLPSAVHAAQHAAVPDTCHALQTQLLGAWKSRNGDGAFETMEFSVDGGRRLFNSWLHERPEFNNAQWRLDGCRLTIAQGADDATSFEFVASLRGKILRIQEAGDEKAAAYVRIPGED